MPLVLKRVKVHVPVGEPRVFEAKDIVALDFGAPNKENPYPHPMVLAVRRKDGTIARYFGLPIETVDEETMVLPATDGERGKIVGA